MKRSLRKYERASLNNSNTETSNNFLTTLGLRPIKKRSSSAVDKLDDKEPKILKQDNSKKILTIGFIGLGNIGTRIVNNLLKSGHKMVVWSRSSEKCESFVEAGAIFAPSAQDVVKLSDIIFSCFGDQSRAYDNLYNSNGILSEITNGKGYVEMSAIDMKTSETFNDDIVSRGGRYLEAMVLGTVTELEEGNLICMAAGDKTLYDECQSSFNAIAKKSFYFDKIGKAVKLNSILSSIKAVIVAGVAESIALADKASISKNMLLEILEKTSTSSSFIITQGNAMINNNNLKVNDKLNYLQRDLFMTLQWSQAMVQSIPIMASVNEAFKTVKNLGYSEHDISAIYNYYTRNPYNGSTNLEENISTKLF